MLDEVGVGYREGHMDVAPGFRSTMRWFLAAITAVAFLVVPLTPAEAHRDGCHRWHSCPSDTGSYVCGDTGHYEQCPGGKPGDSDGSSSSGSGPEPDYDAPSTPRLSDVESAAGGRVTLKVRAEKGSKVEVETDTGRRVAKATATGAKQELAFKAKTGRRTYIVTATDKAGNESLSATKTVTVDATAPKVTQLTAVAGTDVTGASAFSFTSERGARWTLSGAGPKTVRGTSSGSTTTVSLWLPDGSYRPTLIVRDKTGNSTRKTLALRVRVPKPLLHVQQTSTSTVHQLTYALTGTPRSTGHLVLDRRHDQPFHIDDRGQAAVVLDVADGTYGPGRAVLTDFAGRTTTQPLPEVVIDTTPPELTLTTDVERAKTGTLAVQATAEPGSTIHISAPLEGASLDETAPATAEPLQMSRRPAAGTYTVTATAQDAVGNTTTRQVDVQVVIPATPAQIVLGLALLLFLCAVPVAGAIIAWTQRGRIRAWRARRADLARQRAVERAARAAEAVHQRQLAEYRQALAQHQTAQSAWQRDHDHLLALASTARTCRPTTDCSGLVPLKRGETVYGTFPATMVERRTRQGVDAVVEAATGRAVVTSQRVTFVAAKNRDWTFAKLQRIATTHDVTLLTVSNRKQPSGLRLTGSIRDDFRLHLDLALADQHGTRDAVVAQRDDAVRAHQRARPVPPTPPQLPASLAATPAHAQSSHQTWTQPPPVRQPRSASGPAAPLDGRPR